MLTGTTHLTGRVPMVYLDHGTSVPLGFVFQLTDELTPTHITDRFCQAVVFDQVLDGQTLDANHLVFMYDACRELVLVVPSTVIDPSMDFGNLETGLVSVFRAFLFLGMPTLRFCQSFLILGKVARIADALTSRESHHGLDAQVKTDHFIDHWQGLDVLFDQDRDEVAVGTILGDSDRTGFAVFGQGPMPMDIQRLGHLGQSQCASFPLEGVSSIGSRLAMLFFLERGIVRTSLKEIDKGSIQMPQRLLKRNRGNVPKPGVLFLEIREHGRKIVRGQALSMLEIGRLAGLKSPIVDEAATSERLSQNDPLLISGIEPILVRPLRLLAHGLFAFLISFDMLFHRSQNLSIERPIVLLGYRFQLFQDVNTEADRKRLCCFFFLCHIAIIRLNWTYVNRLQYPCAPAPNKERAYIPRLKDGGFTPRCITLRRTAYEEQAIGLGSLTITIQITT